MGGTIPWKRARGEIRRVREAKRRVRQKALGWRLASGILYIYLQRQTKAENDAQETESAKGMRLLPPLAEHLGAWQERLHPNGGPRSSEFAIRKR